jgi:hypothetical protein
MLPGNGMQTRQLPPSASSYIVSKELESLMESSSCGLKGGKYRVTCRYVKGKGYHHDGKRATRSRETVARRGMRGKVI